VTREQRLDRSFFARSSLEVARDLLGRVLVKAEPEGTRLAARIGEIEAYREDDPASHSFRGRTARTEVMFGPPGRLYVYFTYGMHWCANAVTGRDGEGSAVLLRAAEPLDGLDLMRARRRTDDARLLCAGPARLCEAFGITGQDNGVDLVAKDSTLWLEPGSPVPDGSVVQGPRVGISVATDQPWRFAIGGDPYVSRTRPGPTAKQRGLRGSPRPSR
jgi:DNA-3-methyladenine glycosylase